MSDSLLAFRKFTNQKQAEELASILNSRGISARLGDNKPQMDGNYLGAETQTVYEVQIEMENFATADAILENLSQEAVENVSPDHYLFDFSSAELYDLLAHADQWHELDQALAKKILIERGENIDSNYLENLRQQRIDELSKPEPSQKIWVASGYLLALLGGFLGIIIGYGLWTSTRQLPNGQKTPSYSTSDRFHGKIIFFLGLICAFLVILYKILK